ncbi:MAG: PAS domain-containing protein [Rubritepida sp.]|nr:PAS domain-containing protein [Rubritepida sp.]
MRWLPAASLLLPAVMLVLAAWLNWRNAVADAFEQMGRSAEAGAEYGDRAFEGYMVAAGRVNDRLLGMTDAQVRAQQEALHLELVRLQSENRSVAVSFAISRDGWALVGSLSYPIPQNDLTDREYFRTLMPAGRPQAYISQLIRGRDTGRQQFVVARPRAGSGDPPDASGFEGVVLVSVNPESLAGNLRRLARAPDYLGLVREDGHTLVRTLGPQGNNVPLRPEHPFHGVVARGEREANFHGLNQSDGSQVLVAVRRLEHFPIYAAALRPRAVVVEAWRETMVSHLLFGVPATMALFTLSLLAQASRRRLAEANESLRLEAWRSEGRLSRAERMGLFGSFEIDLRSGENFRSAEYMAVQGLAPVARIESHQDWLGRVHEEDRERAERVVLDAVGPGSTTTDYAQTYRIVTPGGQLKWIAARAEIERDDAGHAVAMRGAHVDVTSLREAERALADSDARLRLAQEAAGIGTWEWRADGETRLSRRMLELWGFDRDGPQPGAEAFLSRIHPEDRERLQAEKQAALKGGLLRTECRVLRPAATGTGPVPDGTGPVPDGTAQVQAWVMLRASAQAGSAIPSLIGVSYDVTDRKQAEAEAALLAHEVEHRARNALTVVVGLLRVTQADSVERYAELVEERVQALSRSMALLGRNRFRGAELRALLDHELQPYGTAVTLQGPAVMLQADLAQPLSMAVHELATNAAKYGALSQPEGRLTVTWLLCGRMLVLEWEERGGPHLAAPPIHEGFGSSMITQTFADRLSGGIEREWRPEGLFCRISLELPG